MREFGKLLGLVTVVGFFICGDFYKVSAISCYHCNGLRSCANENLGKNGTLSSHVGEDEVHHIKECENEVEFCYAYRHAFGVQMRGCGGWKRESVTTDCPLVNATVTEEDDRPDTNWTCVCFTDLCNGDPMGCCDEF